MSLQDDILHRKETAIQAAVAYAKENNIARGRLCSSRNALFIGFIIPPVEYHRWADTYLPGGPHSEDTHSFDPVILMYLNHKFGKTVDPDVLPFHAVSNSMGPHHMMYVMDIVRGQWNNPLAIHNIDEVFEENLVASADDYAVKQACQFLREEMGVQEMGELTTYYSIV
ncbi:hypothetical protein K438DRAFT_1998596 [Mycena galopus ATCC 62051]|nr:hypothetical protein K438DRAFT_1998596 [Mycena galopus ATCC 62051]